MPYLWGLKGYGSQIQSSKWAFSTTEREERKREEEKFRPFFHLKMFGRAVQQSNQKDDWQHPVKDKRLFNCAISSPT